MANSKECEICKKMMKQKHKHELFYKIGFWVVLVIAIIFIGLYFSSGEVFKNTNNNITNEANVDIDGSDNNSLVIKNGCYFISQSHK